MKPSEDPLLDSSSFGKKKKKRHVKKAKVAPVTPTVVMNQYEPTNQGPDVFGINWHYQHGLTNEKDGTIKKGDMEMKRRGTAADVVTTLQNVRKGVEFFKNLRCGRRKVMEGTSDGLKESASKKMTLVRGIDIAVSPEPMSPNVANAELIGYFGQLASSIDSNAKIDLEYVEMLLRRGADINSTDKYGQSILHEVARMWDTDVAVFIISKGMDINQPDMYGRTALHVAAAVDYPQMINILLDNGANMEALTTRENQTPLFYAARNDACDALRLLVKKGAKMHVRDYKGRTPLIVAAELDRSETSRLLLEMGAYASDIDRSGHTALQIMVTKMPAVGKEGLDQLYRCDRANRKQYFDLHLLEPIPLEEGREIPARTVLQSIVHYGQQELIMHPVCRELVTVKWKKFGRWGATKQLLFNLLFILMWTVLAVSLETPFEYKFPKDTWRLVLEILGVLLTIYQIVLELKEYYQSKKLFIRWRNWRKSEIAKDLEFCHPQWPQERQYLDCEINEIKDQAPTYFSDKWNLFDWGVYIALLIVTLLHIVDIFVEAPGLSTATQNIFALVIIFVWIRLMKSMRAFTFIGPFIVMLAEIAKDFAIFVYIYANFFIPYACAFWMTYGGKDTVPSMKTVDQMMYSLYRITLVDEYDYDGMRSINVWMTYILLFTFLMISAILCINVLIAMLSNTFQRVYDNATAIALMQQTKIILAIEDGLGKKKKKKYNNFIRDFCSPKELYYDDDMTTEGGQNLEKMTVHIMDSLKELDEFIREEQHVSHSENLTDLKAEMVEYKEAHKKEMKKISSELKLIHELLKVILEKPGNAPSPSLVRPVTALSPLSHPPQASSPRTDPSFLVPTPDPGPMHEDDRRRTFAEEQRMSRREREEREKYLQYLINQSRHDAVPAGGSTLPTMEGATGQDIGGGGDRDVEASNDSVAERVRIRTTTLVHHEKEDTTSCTDDEE